MKPVFRHSIALLLTALFFAGCSTTPDNSDEQRARAKQAQDELSRDTAK
jgi:PBP1b-binding outer membrane lipoprotein LpoB